MSMNETLKEQAQKMVEQLTMIRDDYIKTKQELSFTIRKDEVAVELKDILNNSNSFEDLKQNIQNYINKLLQIDTQIQEK